MKTALLAFVVSLPVFAQNVVPWRAETPSIPSTQAGDPALDSVIIGTDTAQLGIYVYELSGAPLGAIGAGIVRSADVRAPLVAVSSTASGVLLYNLSASLAPATPTSINISTPGQVALGVLSDGGYTVWVDTSSQVLRNYHLDEHPSGFVVVNQPDVTLPGVPSGLAYDDLTGVLYAAVPGQGVVAVDADGGVTTLIATSAGTLGTTLGGIDLLQTTTGLFLFTTAPSDDSVVVHVFDDAGVTLLGAFQVGVPDGGAELARLPSFLDVSTNVPGYPAGALLVHDGINANYKLVSLDDVAAVIPLGGVTPSDGGTGQADAGTGVDAGSGGVMGAVGGPGAPGSGPSAARQQSCSTAPLVALPALLLLWWIRRPRS